MANISSIVNGSIDTSIAIQATMQKKTQLKSNVEIAVLDKALELKKDMVTELLQSLGIGNNINIEG